MALIQALVIVAAIAAVALALLQRAEAARARLEARVLADQAALYLDSGVALVRATLDAMPPDGPVTLRQPWAQPRSGIVIDRGELAWTVEDLQGRFNLGLLAAGDPAIRAGFVQMAMGAGLTRALAERLADLLGPDDDARARAAGAGTPPALPLADPRQVLALADRPGDLDRLWPLVAALPGDALPNINTVKPEVLRALVPGIDGGSLRALTRRLADAPFESADAFLDWAIETLPPTVADQLDQAAFDVGSSHFAVSLVARLDTVALRRSVVLNRDGAQGRSVVALSIPEPE